MKLTTILATSLFLFLTACENGSEFVGKWQSVENSSGVMTIRKNGNSFVIDSSMESVKICKLVDSATLSNGKDFTLVYVKETKQIVIDKQNWHWRKID